MKKPTMLLAAGTAAFSLALLAAPAHSANPQSPNDSSIARLSEKIAALQAQLQAKLSQQQAESALQEIAPALQNYNFDLDQENQAVQQLEQLPNVESGNMSFVMDDEGSSWLGVETHEVTADNAKELKLPAERGVVLGKIVPDSPAAKAGLKEKDVVTEINGQRVEGTAQFRRIIREIPAGRTVQLTVWRDGRSQTVSATLGKAEEGRHGFKIMAPTPGAFAFRMPDTPMIPEIPPMEWNGAMILGGQPRLGIDAEDLSGQLGTFFGAPDGEGILVREVNEGSPAEKAGLKAGDVITSFNGERIRSVGDLREKLSAKRDEKDKTVQLGVLRSKNEVSLTVELPAPATRSKKIVAHRTNI
jgi:serine protease Do